MIKPLDQVIEYFKTYCKRTNHIHSAIIDIFQIIIKEEIIVLLQHLVNLVYFINKISI